MPIIKNNRDIKKHLVKPGAVPSHVEKQDYQKNYGGLIFSKANVIAINIGFIRIIKISCFYFLRKMII